MRTLAIVSKFLNEHRLNPYVFMRKSHIYKKQRTSNHRTVEKTLLQTIPLGGYP